MSTASMVMGVSTSTASGWVRLNAGARLSTTTSTTSSSVSSSSSTTNTLTLHVPLFDQFHWVQQLGASIISIKPARDSISNTQSTSPPSMSKLCVAFSVTFSNVYFPSSTVMAAVGARPMKMEMEASLLLRLASAVTFWSGSTVNVMAAVPTIMLAGTDQLTSTRSSAYGATAGMASRSTALSGVSISITVAGAVSTPRFWAGREKLSTSPGRAL